MSIRIENHATKNSAEADESAIDSERPSMLNDDTGLAALVPEPVDGELVEEPVSRHCQLGLGYRA